MDTQYTAIVKQQGDWWIGWIEEVPGVNCQEHTREELVETLCMTLQEAIDKLISTLDKSDKELDELWIKEAEDRIDAYDQGKMKAISLENVLQKDW
jgi:hypothetical protein